MSKYLLAIDQGTTSTRAVLFNLQGQPVDFSQLPLQQYFPHDGWVEHDPAEIWQATLSCCRDVLKKVGTTAKEIVGIGITNQRETTIIWDRKTGKAIHNAIVWQDRRTSNVCQELAAKPGVSQMVQNKTGLLLDPYFSATKINWLLDHVPNARQRALKGELAFGTVDSFLLWQLTKGKVHATDATNAARTMIFNIRTQQWDSELLQLFNVPTTLLPEVKDNCADFGDTDAEWFGAPIAIAGMAGDQQAALVGQACFEPGTVKSTYGTGCFLLFNTGTQIVESQNQLLTTIGYRLNGEVTYATEGSIFAAGSTVQWLRDQMHFVKDSADSEHFASTVADNGGVYLVPAFTGLGAPYWDPLVRGAILGLTRDTQIAHIVRAGLESIAYQTCDLLEAIINDGATHPIALRVDGGMVRNNWVMQFLADMLKIPVDRAAVVETTALGVAYLAGLQTGCYQSLNEIASLWQSQRRFEPVLSDELRTAWYQGWKKAVIKVCQKV